MMHPEINLEKHQLQAGLCQGLQTPSVEADAFGNASSTASHENELQSNLQISAAFCIKTNRESSQRQQMMRPLSVSGVVRFMMIYDQFLYVI